MLSALFSVILASAPVPLWMVGTWCTAPTNGRQMCERWEGDPQGGLSGVAEVRRDGAVSPGETMRIAQQGGVLVFHAEPRGQAPTDFRAIMVSADAITFENRAHDYPQRVRYWREGAALMAEISLADGSKPMRWTFHRTGE
ncbi:DUF6265 family protein [Sphingomonas hengshuiensis]|uniref:DUF6265 family protein n=1 Tax=Sphingomonas hengshuiensis TaxID=1609977 RepID=UPI000698B058|nr:DUF6265 family protein [Sphingomonas hengshuiensis]